MAEGMAEIDEGARQEPRRAADNMAVYYEPFPLGDLAQDIPVDVVESRDSWYTYDGEYYGGGGFGCGYGYGDGDGSGGCCGRLRRGRQWCKDLFGGWDGDWRCGHGREFYVSR